MKQQFRWNRFRFIMVITLCTTCLTGCAFRHYPLIKGAVDEGRIPQLYDVSGYSYKTPESRSGQRYRQLELLQNVRIRMEEGDAVCSFVLGKRMSDGNWEIVSAAQRRDDGIWADLEVKPESSATEAIQTVAATKR